MVERLPHQNRKAIGSNPVEARISFVGSICNYLDFYAKEGFGNAISFDFPNCANLSWQQGKFDCDRKNRTF